MSRFRQYKKYISAFLTLVLVLSVFPAASLTGLEELFPKASAADIVRSGVCGAEVTWTLDSDGLLIISGAGNMIYHGWSNTPSYANEIKKGVIEDGVTSICDHAFQGCKGLTSIMIPDSVKSIGEYAFHGCSGLKSITIPDSVTSIGVFAFYGCASLTSINISDSVTSIGGSAFIGTSLYNDESNWTDGVLYIGNHLIKAKSGTRSDYSVKEGTVSIAQYAFYDYDGIIDLKSITIPDSVTSIGDSAFEYCYGLTSITIPDSVKSIGGSAFIGTSLYDDESNWTDGVLYIGNHLIRAKSGTRSDYSVKEGTVSIANSAFDDYENRIGLKSITIPDSVKIIGDYAFFDCTGLKSITIPDSVTCIGGEAFNGCTGLKSITIPDSVKIIGDYAFYYCTGLKSITIPDSVTSIGECAFSYCSGLTSIMVENGNTVYHSDGNCLIETESKTLIVGYKNSVIPAEGSVKSIGDRAFEYCHGLKNITIPDSVKSIGVRAFCGCEGLSNISIPDGVTFIGDHAFSGCSGLTSISIPDGVTFIGDQAFSGCSGLTSISIPDSVTSICDGAFWGCKELTSIMIPDGVTSIGDSAFEGCKGLTSVTIPDGVTFIGDYAFEGCKGLSNISIPDSVTSIGDRAFYGCASLTSITIPDGVTFIGDHAFYGCKGLTSVTIPDNVTRIYESTFSGCSGLTSVTMSASVTRIYERAFGGCSSLTDVYYLGTESQWKAIIFVSIEDNSPLINATIHFESSGAMTISQKHVVSNYKNVNSSVSEKYYAGCATPLDGTNGTADMVIPGLSAADDMIPQGISYYPAKNWILISAYHKSGKNPGVIYALNFDTGRFEAQFDLYDEQGKADTSHMGGIAVTDNNLYIAHGGSGISYVPLSELDVVRGTKKDLIIAGTVGLKPYCNAASSYLSFSEGMLWTGNFYDKSADYNTPAASWVNSRILGFALSGDDSDSEWESLCKGSGIAAPVHNVDLPNEINNIQGVAVKDGMLYLSSSFGRRNVGHLYIIDLELAERGAVASAFRSETALPMAENLLLKDGDLYTLSESAAWYYNGRTPNNRSLDPTDVVWRINLDDLFGVDPTASTTGDVDRVNVTFKIDKIEGDTDISFKQAWLSRDSIIYNHQLGTFCCQFAMLGYDDNLKDGNGNIIEKKPNLKAALQTIGMKDIDIVGDAGQEQVNSFIAHRPITVNGETYTLLFTGFIGSFKKQWYSNFDPGTGSTHKGFLNAKNYMLKRLNTYISTYLSGVDKGHMKILITGHSRGAATANLVAAKLISDESLALKENIYTYAFATPNSTTLPERKNDEFKRIFNVVNPEDFVTKCMPARWHYGRYGVTYTLPSKTNCPDAYSRYLKEMRVYFSKFKHGEKYVPFTFGEVATYRVIRQMCEAVPTVNDFSKKNLRWNSIPTSLQDFFNDTLCGFLAEDGVAKGLAAVALVETFSAQSNPLLLLHTSSVLYNVSNYFVGNQAIGSLTHDILSEGYFAEAHCAETYCAYMMSMSESSLTRYRSAYLNSVNCPVDVEIYDNTTGELVGRIVNNVVDEEILGKENSVYVAVNGDEKTFWLPADGDYDVRLIGNATGAMDYSLTAIDPEDVDIDRASYFQLPLGTDKTYTAGFEAECISAEEVIVRELDSDTRVADDLFGVDDMPVYTVSLTAEGNGLVSEDQYVTAGEYVTVIASPEENSIFVGWYADGNKVSDDPEYRFRPAGNIQIAARFEVKPPIDPPVTEPPASEPPATEHPATEPPATEPPATEPPSTEPPVTESPATEPPATDVPATTTQPRVGYQLGDIDKDGKVTSIDARKALRIAAKLDTCDELEAKLADMDGDGKVTSIDARIILRIAAKLDPMPDKLIYAAA